MFFGAGNIIFPLIVGNLSGNQTPYAILGLGLSAVAFPFLGLIAMMLYGGEIHTFLGRLGKWPAMALLFILQMSQGPTGAMPRLITLMHASVKEYLPISLFFFSILISLGIFLLTYRPQKIVELLGKFLTPILLATLAILVIFGIYHAPVAQTVSGSSSSYFFQGLKLGYQTTDLIAALLFATLILPHLSQGTEHLPPEERKTLIHKRMRGASLIASILLMITYIGLCWLSAHHSWTLQGPVAPEELLQKISYQILGPVGSAVASIAIFLACLTTAISLAAIFSDYLRNDKTGPIFPLVFTVGLSAAMANLGFSGIVRLWGPLLEVLYPALIVLCLFNIAHRLYHIKPIQEPVFFVLGLAIGGFYLG